jgi:hypothetical protein
VDVNEIYAYPDTLLLSFVTLCYCVCRFEEIDAAFCSRSYSTSTVAFRFFLEGTVERME